MVGWVGVIGAPREATLTEIQHAADLDFVLGAGLKQMADSTDSLGA